MFLMTYIFQMMRDIERFLEMYCSAEGVQELGWQLVPSIDVEGLKTWEEIIVRAVVKGFGRMVSKGWFTHPIALHNQAVFKVNPDFLDDIKRCKRKEDVWKLFRKFKINGKSRRIKKLDSTEWNEDSHAWNMHMDDLVETSIPVVLKGGASSAILALGKWFTDAHIEEGGDDSISYTPIGQKIFLIADRGIYSNDLFKTIVTVDDFARVMLQGPTRLQAKHVKVFIPDAKTLLVQPGLSCHSVLTVSTGREPSFLTGWEASDPRDTKRKAQVIRNYTPGICGRKLRNMLRESSLQEVAKVVKKRRKQRKGKLPCNWSNLVSGSSRKLNRRWLKRSSRKGSSRR